jgi:hypothetical protein
MANEELLALCPQTSLNKFLHYSSVSDAMFSSLRTKSPPAADGFTLLILSEACVASCSDQANQSS